MPRYFFHVHNVEIQAEDEEGLELVGPDDARKAAIEGIRSILKAELDEGKIDLRGRIDVTDGNGSAVMTVPYAEALDLHLPDVSDEPD